jgi:Na+-transporting NADH:ubiquinone oxidoreductase subunit NqrE
MVYIVQRLYVSSVLAGVGWGCCGIAALSWKVQTNNALGVALIIIVLPLCFAALFHLKPRRSSHAKRDEAAWLVWR